MDSVSGVDAAGVSVLLGSGVPGVPGEVSTLGVSEPFVEGVDEPGCDGHVVSLDFVEGVSDVSLGVAEEPGKLGVPDVPGVPGVPGVPVVPGEPGVLVSLDEGFVGPGPGVVVLPQLHSITPV